MSHRLPMNISRVNTGDAYPVCDGVSTLRRQVHCHSGSTLKFERKVSQSERCVDSADRVQRPSIHANHRVATAKRIRVVHVSTVVFNDVNEVSVIVMLS